MSLGWAATKMSAQTCSIKRKKASCRGTRRTTVSNSVMMLGARTMAWWSPMRTNSNAKNSSHRIGRADTSSSSPSLVQKGRLRFSIAKSSKTSCKTIVLTGWAQITKILSSPSSNRCGKVCESPSWSSIGASPTPLKTTQTMPFASSRSHHQSS